MNIIKCTPLDGYIRMNASRQILCELFNEISCGKADKKRAYPTKTCASGK